jgi:hypothetical protein
LACKKTKPSLDIINKCHDCNSDGIGVAWFKGNKVAYKKGLKPGDAFNLIQTLQLPFSMHFRMASCGGKDPLLNHPFEIDRKSPLVMEGECEQILLHNGHWGDWEKCLAAANIYPDKDDIMSDTRAIAMLLHNNMRFIEHIHGKFLVMDGATQTTSITPFTDFTEIDGILYSNTFWQYGGRNHSRYPATSRVTIDGWDESEWNYSPQGDVKTPTNTGNAAIPFNREHAANYSKRQLRKSIKKKRSQIYLRVFQDTGSSILAAEAAAAYNGEKVESVVVDVETVSDLDRMSTEQPTPHRIHEQPPLPPFFTDKNTQKILGCPPSLSQEQIAERYNDDI